MGPRSGPLRRGGKRGLAVTVGCGARPTLRGEEGRAGGLRARAGPRLDLREEARLLENLGVRSEGVGGPA